MSDHSGYTLLENVALVIGCVAVAFIMAWCVVAQHETNPALRCLDKHSSTECARVVPVPTP